MGKLRNPPETRRKRSRLVNEELSDALSAVDYECKLSTDVFGGGALTYGKIFNMLAAFKKKHRHERRPLQIVKVDFTACFDRIRQDKMVEILEKVSLIFFKINTFKRAFELFLGSQCRQT